MDITLSLEWALATAGTLLVSGFTWGCWLCKKMDKKDTFETIEAFCDVAEEKHAQGTKTLLSLGIKTITPMNMLKITLKNSKAYHVDCKFLDMTTKTCRVNAQICKLLKNPNLHLIKKCL